MLAKKGGEGGKRGRGTNSDRGVSGSRSGLRPKITGHKNSS